MFSLIFPEIEVSARLRILKTSALPHILYPSEKLSHEEIIFKSKQKISADNRNKEKFHGKIYTDFGK